MSTDLLLPFIGRRSARGPDSRFCSSASAATKKEKEMRQTNRAAFLVALLSVAPWAARAQQPTGLVPQLTAQARTGLAAQLTQEQTNPNPTIIWQAIPSLTEDLGGEARIINAGSTGGLSAPIYTYLIPTNKWKSVAVARSP